MDRVAVFVDAGYLFAQGSALLTGQKKLRGDLVLDYDKAIAALVSYATTVSALPLLRVYWYDGTSTGPTAQHLTLAHMPNVKVRLGFVNAVGQQKGVDSLIVTDMLMLARNRGMSAAVLLSGDEDLRVGVQQAQEFGVRVHLLGIKPSRGSQSLFLMQEADTTHELLEADVKGFLAYQPRPALAAIVAAPAQPPTSAVASVPSPAVVPAAVVSSAADAQLVIVAAEIADRVPAEYLAAVVAARRSGSSIPREYDAALLARAGITTGAPLISSQKSRLRKAFIEACEKRLGPEA